MTESDSTLSSPILCQTSELTKDTKTLLLSISSSNCYKLHLIHKPLPCNSTNTEPICYQPNLYPIDLFDSMSVSCFKSKPKSTQNELDMGICAKHYQVTFESSFSVLKSDSLHIQYPTLQLFYSTTQSHRNLRYLQQSDNSYPKATSYTKHKLSLHRLSLWL